jgi:hypothetical protein
LLFRGHLPAVLIRQSVVTLVPRYYNKAGRQFSNRPSFWFLILHVLRLLHPYMPPRVQLSCHHLLNCVCVAQKVFFVNLAFSFSVRWHLLIGVELSLVFGFCSVFFVVLLYKTITIGASVRRLFLNISGGGIAKTYQIYYYFFFAVVFLMFGRC